MESPVTVLMSKMFVLMNAMAGIHMKMEPSVRRVDFKKGDEGRRRRRRGHGEGDGRVA